MRWFVLGWGRPLRFLPLESIVLSTMILPRPSRPSEGGARLLPVAFRPCRRRSSGLRSGMMAARGRTVGRPRLSFFLPVCVCVPLALQQVSGHCVCWGGGPEASSASASDFGMYPWGSAFAVCPVASDVLAVGAEDASHPDLSWRSPGGVRSMARVNSKNAVRWPASSWRCSLSAPTRRNRASARPSQSSQTRGGARWLLGRAKKARGARD